MFNLFIELFVPRKQASLQPRGQELAIIERFIVAIFLAVEKYAAARQD